MVTKSRFLAFLWLFIGCNFVFFQNSTRNGSPAELHNDLCKQNQDLNESRILQSKVIQTDLLSLWPKSANSPADGLKSTSDHLLDANRRMFEACLADSEGVRESQNLALSEMKKLADPDSNHTWKSYLALIESTITSLRKGPL
jgi:hypothetical protein